MSLFHQQKYGPAESWFRLTVKADPRYKEAWQALADTFKAEGKTTQASAAQKIADTSPDTREGEPPPLTPEQKQVLDSAAPPTPTAPAVAKTAAVARVALAQKVAPPAAAPPVSAAAPLPHAIAFPPQSPRPGWVIGRAVFADGRPLPKFAVTVGGYDVTSEVTGGLPTVGYVEAVSGQYAVQTKDSFSHKRPIDARVTAIGARAELPYDGQTFKVEMVPADGHADINDGKQFLGHSSKGLVRNFVLRLSGPRPGHEGETPEQFVYGDRSHPLAFCGATIAITMDTTSHDILQLKKAYPPDSRVVIMLTPNGPLIDGSAGRVITRRVPPGVNGNYNFYLHDIPLGVYTATAQLVAADGTASEIQIGTWVNKYESSVRAAFKANDIFATGADTLNLYLIK